MPTYSTIDLFVIGDRGDDLGFVFGAPFREKKVDGITGKV